MAEFTLPVKEDGTNFTFDEIISDKAMQSEFDKRVSKALETAKGNWQTKIDNEKAEWQKTRNAEVEAAKTAAAATFEAEKTELNKKLLKASIVGEIIKANAIDESDILKMLDIDKISMDDEGIKGLSEQLEELKTNKAYLFKNTETSSEKKKTGLAHDDKTSEEALIKARVRAAAGLKKKE